MKDVRSSKMKHWTRALVEPSAWDQRDPGKPHSDDGRTAEGGGLGPLRALNVIQFSPPGERMVMNWNPRRDSARGRRNHTWNVRNNPVECVLRKRPDRGDNHRRRCDLRRTESDKPPGKRNQQVIGFSVVDRRRIGIENGSQECSVALLATCPSEIESTNQPLVVRSLPNQPPDDPLERSLLRRKSRRHQLRREAQSHKDRNRSSGQKAATVGSAMSVDAQPGKQWGS